MISFAFLAQNYFMYRPAYDPDSFYHWHTVPVRFRDLDVLNHVNNAVFNTYFEEARINFVSGVPELADSWDQGKSFVLVKCTLEYLKPVIYPSTLLIGTSGLSIGNTSIEAIQGMYEKETKELKAVAITKGVWFDLKRNRPCAVPEISNVDSMMFNQESNG